MSQATFSREELAILKIWRNLMTSLLTNPDRMNPNMVCWDDERHIVICGPFGHHSGEMEVRLNTSTLHVEFKFLKDEVGHPAKDWHETSFGHTRWVLVQLIGDAQWQSNLYEPVTEPKHLRKWVEQRSQFIGIPDHRKDRPNAQVREDWEDTHG